MFLAVVAMDKGFFAGRYFAFKIALHQKADEGFMMVCSNTCKPAKRRRAR